MDTTVKITLTDNRRFARYAAGLKRETVGRVGVLNEQNNLVNYILSSIDFMNFHADPFAHLPLPPPASPVLELITGQSYLENYIDSTNNRLEQL